MEEDIDDKFFYQFPDHPALLSAQQPYAQILSDATAAGERRAKPAAMSATPEDFLAAQEGAAPYLVAPEPFSPSVFLDLPPTPGRPADSNDPDNSDDLILPFISRMIMEEDIDDKFFYQFPNHPALLTAQQPYAKILSDSAATASSPSDSSYAATKANTTTTSSSGSGTTANSTLSPSSDAPASFADLASWAHYEDAVDLSHLLRSPTYPAADIGVGLDDFAEFLSPAQGQDAAPAGFHFHQSPPFSDGGGGSGGEA